MPITHHVDAAGVASWAAAADGVGNIHPAASRTCGGVLADGKRVRTCRDALGTRAGSDHHPTDDAEQYTLRCWHPLRFPAPHCSPRNPPR